MCAEARRTRAWPVSAFALAAAVASPAPAAAGDPIERPVVHASTGASLYADGMRTVVWTPHVAAGAVFSNGLSLDLSWDLDVITSASVDVITAATGRMNDERNVLNGSVVWAPTPRISVTAGYSFSLERDFVAHTPFAAIKGSVFGDRLDLGATYSVSLTRAGVRGEPAEVWRAANLHTAEVLATFVADRSTLLDVVLSFFLADGYLANPYRRVPVLSSGDLRDALWLEESVPGTRVRSAVTLRARRTFGTRWMTAADYRFYWDDWGLVAHTASASAVAGLPASLALEMRLRGSWQSGAWFYQTTYSEPTEYRTRDRRLSPSEVYTGGVALLWDGGPRGPLAAVDVRLGVDAHLWHHGRFLAPDLTLSGDPVLVPLGWVPGVVVQLGVEIDL